MSRDTQPPIDDEAASAPTPETENDAAPTESLDETGELLARIDQLQQELAAEKDRSLRAAADFDNYRRRVTREKDDLRQSVESAVIEELLPALDNFQIGLDHAAKATSAADVAQGFEFIVQQIRQILEQRGLQAIAPAPGDEFDHHRHDAVGHEASDEITDHHILRVMRPGYQLGERLLRAASVVVSSGPDEA